MRESLSVSLELLPNMEMKVNDNFENDARNSPSFIVFVHLFETIAKFPPLGVMEPVTKYHQLILF